MGCRAAAPLRNALLGAAEKDAATSSVPGTGRVAGDAKRGLLAFLRAASWKTKGRETAINRGAFQPGEPGAGNSWHFTSCK